MVTRVYIDNFRCFSNFEWEAGGLNLLLGENGTGKSSIFEVIVRVVNFALGGLDAASFRLQDNCCAWDKRSEQTFEISFRNSAGDFTYRLVLERPNSGDLTNILTETIRHRNVLLYVREQDTVNIYDEDGSQAGAFPFSGDRSVVGMLSGGSKAPKLTAFVETLRNVYLFRPDPLVMKTVSDSDVRVANASMDNLVGWMSHLGNMSADFGARMLKDLRDVLTGLQTYRLPPAGLNTRALQLSFSSGDSGAKNGTYDLYLDQLSHGQRMLIALYAILHGIVGNGTTVLIDEPDNYVSSRELQPWIRAMEAAVDSLGGQVMLISHHPEILNYLAVSHGTRFVREDNGPVRVKHFEWEPSMALTPAEAVARGWID